MKLFGSLAELVKVVFRQNGVQQNLEPNQATTYSTDRTIQLPQLNGDEVIVGRTSADQQANRLQNKDLDDSTVLLVNMSDTTKKVKFQTSGITTATTRTLTVPDASDTLTLNTTAQTLTNKTISGSSNTLSNISLTSSVTGVLPAANGGTGVNNGFTITVAGAFATVGANALTLTTTSGTNVTLPTTGTLATLAGVESLTNKTLDNSNSVTLKTGSFTLQDTAAPSKTFVVQASGATASTSMTLAAAQTANRVVTLPDATDTLVGKATTDTLTNKSISGSTNTITNVSLTAGVTGTLPIANGGTNGTSQTAGFDNLAPTTTKGDLAVYNGTHNVRLGVGTDGFALVASSGAATGLAYASVATNSLNQFNVNVGDNTNTAIQVNTSTTGDIEATTTTGFTINQIVTHDTTQFTSKTIASGDTCIYPRMIVDTADTWTIASGAHLYVYDKLIVNGTLITNGNSVVTNMGL